MCSTISKQYERFNFSITGRVMLVNYLEIREKTRNYGAKSPQVRLNMNEKKPSKSQFNFPTLLGPCSMLKKLSKKIS